MDVYITLTYRTCIPYDSEDIDIAELNEHDALAQLQSETILDLQDNWTLIATDVSTLIKPEE